MLLHEYLTLKLHTTSFISHNIDDSVAATLDQRDNENDSWLINNELDFDCKLN